MQSIVILGTGGTIAGASARSDDSVGYRAGALGVQALIDAVPPLAGRRLEAEEVARIDSKDMDAATWQHLARRAAHHLARDDVAGVVVTHGTDTLEETAWFLHRVLAVLDGDVHGAAGLRKRHTRRADAFRGGDAGPLAGVADGVVRRWRDWPAGEALGLDTIAAAPADWPWVAMVANHAGADGREVRALRAAGVRGLVVAGTGNATLSAPLAGALREARDAGVAIVVGSRCADGEAYVVEPGSDVAAAGAPFASAGERSPWQARVDLLLDLLAQP